MSFSRNISEEKIITVEIKDVSAEGYGVGKLEDGKIVFVENCLRGEVVEATLQKNRKNYCEAKLKRVLKPSVYRVGPQCAHFGLCGGCRLQHSDYSEQLYIKTKIVKDALERIGKQFVDVIFPIEGSEKVYDYRNKLEYAFTNRAWLSTEEIQTGETFDRRGVGFHLPGNYAAVLDINRCHLMEISNQIKN
ncbi:MAG: TRAM domain-containing protein, partial [Chitinophagales bacterium]|nr:TRAM domain-containing protein [Chitinophagales bacterium]